jgi:hypothetical protein
MATIVYLLCTVASGLCAVLLLREHGKTASRLLFWSGLSFTAMAATNALVFIDFIVLPTSDLAVIRGAIFVLAVGLLLYGLVRNVD